VSDARGVLIVLGAPDSFALYNVLLQPLLERHGVIRQTAAASLAGTLALLSLARPSTFTSLGTMSPRDLGLLLYLGVVCTPLGYLGWNAGLCGLGSTRAVSYTYAIPPLAVAIGAVTLAAPVGPWLLVGGGVIILGVALAQQGAGRDRRERASADPAVIPET